MNVLDHLRLRQAQQFVVALHILMKVLEALAPVLCLAQLEALDHGAHGAIEDGDAFREDGGQRLGAGVGRGVHGGIVGRLGGERANPCFGPARPMPDNSPP